MARTNTKNAHIREEVKPKRREDDALDAERLLRDPAFIRAFDNVENALIKTLKEFQHDGQPETDDNEREICRSLRTLHRVKRAVTLTVQGQKLRAVDFAPKAPEPDEGE